MAAGERGRGSTFIHLQAAAGRPAVFFGVCFFKESGRWRFTAVAAAGSLLGPQRKLTVNSGPKIKMLIAARPHFNSFLAWF